MHDVEGQWGEEAEEEGGCHPLIASTDGEHFGRNGPGDGEGVELLNVGAGPDRGTFD